MQIELVSSINCLPLQFFLLDFPLCKLAEDLLGGLVIITIMPSLGFFHDFIEILRRPMKGVKNPKWSVDC